MLTQGGIIHFYQVLSVLRQSSRERQVKKHDAKFEISENFITDHQFRIINLYDSLI